MPQRWNDYYKPGFDELTNHSGTARPVASKLTHWFDSLDDEELANKQHAAQLTIVQMGITFTIYSEKGNIDRAWPLDIAPRVIAASEWREIEKGLKRLIFSSTICITNNRFLKTISFLES